MIALAGAGAEEGLWLRAEQQTAGRGRLGRDWASAPGNLYASTLVRPRAGDPSAATLAFVAAVALDEVVSAYADPSVLILKWPNDLLLNGAKLSGILLERTEGAVVIGMGVNLADHPRSLDRPVTSLAGAGYGAPDPALFLADLADAFARWLATWRQGLPAVLARWQARAHPRGTALSVHLPGVGQREGLFAGLDADGALRLRLAGGAEEIIHAGDVFMV
ncbi:biotin--[acetyl-CoA-carboxylase] ligase [Sphingomonas flavalba]|uniref:biotin--[acetyl-CoA-carboxylase] ligase n=1 Tax=Sphingomonas flavalba TaxID=2559804 RepID=UPI0039E12F64